MATTVAQISFSGVAAANAEGPKFQKPLASPFLKCPWRAIPRGHCAVHLRTKASASSSPKSLSDQIADSIKKAEETCAGDAITGECAAAWDEVEEVSAAASHLRARKKDSDPLEEYCKDNPETDECRTYDD